MCLESICRDGNLCFSLSAPEKQDHEFVWVERTVAIWCSAQWQYGGVVGGPTHYFDTPNLDVKLSWAVSKKLFDTPTGGWGLAGGWLAGG